MAAFLAGSVLNCGRETPRVACRRRGRAVHMAAPGTSGGFRAWEVEEDGKVSMPSPFGIVRRDLQELAPMVLMAAEMQNLDVNRLAALKKILAEPSSSSSQMLAATSEMRFFPPEAVVPSLLECLRTTPDELTRSQIVWALALFRQGDDDCWKAILNELEDLSSPTVSSAAAGALGHIGDPEAITPLVRAYTMSTDFIVQMSAIVSLGSIGDVSVLPQLVNWLAKYDSEKINRDSLLVQALLGAIGDLRQAEGVDVLLKWCQNPEPLIRHQVAEALINIGVENDKVEQALKKLAGDSEKVVSYSAERHLDTYRKRRASK
eukprot:Plantae.Rhodophyta-Purpureofilum_apyrenoidigerum.ctg32748.p1 GENE.Plantae.Rhodophyta-Purpureofilum_apyrenoidigerum.ctg32748~~Plantae.Rhodophyta-Purpureofilum_apyrenoidigerum.ctg32748.p1  ORF type:complete len:333 (-),score=55.54 Plantae.Rhodophyta-Purpureofilum_apyrenoidigerum.ctg32748:355-1311(-)